MLKNVWHLFLYLQYKAVVMGVSDIKKKVFQVNFDIARFVTQYYGGVAAYILLSLSLSLSLSPSLSPSLCFTLTLFLSLILPLSSYSHFPFCTFFSHSFIRLRRDCLLNTGVLSLSPFGCCEIRVCVCVCVCVREREKERERESGIEENVV